MGWRSLGRAGLAMAGGLFGVAAGLIGGCQSGPFVQTEQYVTREGQEQQIGSACAGFEKDSGFGAGLLPGVPGAGGDSDADETSGYAFKYEGTGNSLRLSVTDGHGHTMAQRSYDGAFVDSGRKDELSVEAGEQKLRFVAWRVSECP
jgi:hypothetical protein